MPAASCRDGFPRRKGFVMFDIKEAAAERRYETKEWERNSLKELKVRQLRFEQFGQFLPMYFHVFIAAPTDKCLFALQAWAVKSVCVCVCVFSVVSSEAARLSDRADCGQTPAASRQFTPHQTFIRA